MESNNTLIQGSTSHAADLEQKYERLSLYHSALFEITELTNNCHDIDSFYKNVHRVVASLTNAENCYIVLYDQVNNELEFVYHVDEQDTFPKGSLPFSDFDGSLTKVVIEDKKPLLANPQLTEQLTKEGRISDFGAQCFDWLGVPLIEDGYVIGLIAVQSYDEKNRYSESDKDLLNFVAQHLVSAMKRFQDREQLQKAVKARTKELLDQIREREHSELLQESLFHISQLTNADLDIYKFYDKVRNIIGQLLHASNFYIAKYDKESNEVDFVYYFDQITENMDSDFKKRPASRYLTEYVLRQGQTVLLSGSDIEKLYLDGEILNNNIKSKSWLGVPLLSEGEAIGVMVIQSYRDDILFTDQDAELLNFVSQHVTSAIIRREATLFQKQSHELLEKQVKNRTLELEEEIQQRKSAEAKLTYAASHDILTGLPNRRVFIELLGHAIAVAKRNSTYKFAVLFLDLDRFKAVNDSMGHHAGDMLLKSVAEKLKFVVRDMDTVARLGGDEFVILIEDIKSDSKALEIAQRITTMLESPFTIDGQQAFIGTSIGLLYHNERYFDPEVMLRDADTAMYYAKEKGKGRVEIFDSSMQEKVQNAIQLEVDIRNAIENNEFVPYFQPVVRIATNEIVGFEALARWNSEKRGFVMPGDFIPLAEETGLVNQIDLIILDKAMAQLKQWHSTIGNHDIYMSANLFCSHFYSPNLIDDVNDLLNKHQLSAHCIRLELTERALIDNAHLVLKNITKLKQMGIKILLDDFGTGYSSLSYLYRFPIDVLKIDRSFIQNMNKKGNHKAIVKTIIDLAKNLGMGAISEGIEEPEQVESLDTLNCEYGQGYFYAKPMESKNAKMLLLNGINNKENICT